MILHVGNMSLDELSLRGDLPKLDKKCVNKSNKVFPVGLLNTFQKMKAPVKYTAVQGIRCTESEIIFPISFSGNIQTDVREIQNSFLTELFCSDCYQ